MSYILTHEGNHMAAKGKTATKKIKGKGIRKDILGTVC